MRFIPDTGIHVLTTGIAYSYMTVGQGYQLSSDGPGSEHQVTGTYKL